MGWYWAKAAGGATESAAAVASAILIIRIGWLLAASAPAGGRAEGEGIAGLPPGRRSDLGYQNVTGRRRLQSPG